MKFKLKPKNNEFFNYLVNPTKKLYDAIIILTQMVESTHEENREQCKIIDRIESEADKDQVLCFRAISNSFITPYSRDSLFTLAVEIENCIDHVNETAETILTINLSAYPSKIKKQLEYILEAGETLLDMMKGLDNIHELNHQWSKIKELESKGDLIKRSLLITIFEMEKDPIRLLKIKTLSEELEQILNTMQLIVRITESIAINE